jgi:hypothetical protein
MGGKSKADAFKVIQDISATAIGDMVEAAELFNQVNGTEFDGIVVPTETVAFCPGLMWNPGRLLLSGSIWGGIRIG